MRRTVAGLGGSVLLALATIATGQTTTATGSVETQASQLDAAATSRGQSQVAAQIASNFGTLAGSEANALSLVNALRSGSAVTLTTAPSTPGGAPPTTTFTPPTGKMGWGNVFTSLALAKDALARLGITNPTNAQLQAALMGGDVTKADGTSVTLKGILQMRADGMGWGRIAQVSGTKLGPVVSAIKSTQVKVAGLPKTQPVASAAAPASRGVLTAVGGGGVNNSGHGNAQGRGIVSAAGGTVGGAMASGSTGQGHQGQGAGVVTGVGHAASPVTNAGGGNGGEHGKGKGKGGG